MSDRMRAIDESSVAPKAFLFAYLHIVDITEPVTYVARKSKRKRAPQPDKFVEGWAFHLPMPAFAASLDLARVARIRVDLATKKKKTFREWTQGHPPQFSFEVGDIFYSDPSVRLLAWGAVPEFYAIQVDASHENTVQFRLIEFRRGACVSVKAATLAMNDFVTVLRDGLPGFATENRASG
ncbi:hypothetical protein [Rhodoblastus acidophilus]|nr:hypothetical protein [Rhodoblastus acidophilus]MCW2317234.1 hypothetical protein [Rhodoblastus acidophilus]